METLENALSALNLNVPMPGVNNAEVLANPLDVYRTYLAEVLAGAVDCDINVAYKSIQWPNNIFNGDLAVILPKLQPGAKAEEVAVGLMKKVRTFHIEVYDIAVAKSA